MSGILLFVSPKRFTQRKQTPFRLELEVESMGVVATVDLLSATCTRVLWDFPNIKAGGKDDRRRTSNRVFSTFILRMRMPHPSMMANRIAKLIAAFLAAFIPPRIANEPPARKPAITTSLSADLPNAPVIPDFQNLVARHQENRT